MKVLSSKNKDSFREFLPLLKKLNTPAKIQDYLNTIPFNFEEDGSPTLRSPFYVLKTNKAHCMEGALLACFILDLHGIDSYLMHLKSAKGDYDHVVALFKENNLWGAISKTNHYVLRYREPVYKNVRELAMSYFHEYFLNKNRKKTLRDYSSALSINKFKSGWETAEDDLWYIDEMLDDIKHYEIVPKNLLKRLRLVDEIEQKAGGLVDFKPINKGFKDPNLI